MNDPVYPVFRIFDDGQIEALWRVNVEAWADLVLARLRDGADGDAPEARPDALPFRAEYGTMIKEETR